MGTKKKEIRSYDELGQDEQFTFGNKTYTVPAITQEVSEKLAEKAAEMQKAIDEKDFVRSNVLAFEYVALAMAENHSKDELRQLPKQVISAIMNLLSSEMMGVPTAGDVTEDQAEEVKK